MCQAAKRAQYEEAARHEEIANYRITECDRQDRLVPVSSRGEYFPIYFVEPADGNVAALGFDLATIPACREAMKRACDTGELVATPAIALSHEADDQGSFRLILAVYRRAAPIGSIDERRRALQGFAVAVVRAKGLVEEGLASCLPAGLDVQLVDGSAPDQPVLYVHRSRLSAQHGDSRAAAAFRLQTDLRMPQTFDAGRRRWTIACTAVPEYVAMRSTGHPWSGAAACFLLTLSLAAYLVGIAVRNAKTIQLAAGLSEANLHLEREVSERKQAESTLWNSEIRYKTLFDTSGDAILLTTTEGEILDGNHAAAAIFGCKNEFDLTSLTPADVSPEYQPDGTLSSTKCQQMMAIVMRDGSHRFEWTHKRIDGTEFLASVCVNRMEVDREYLLLGTVRDITEQRQADESLRWKSAFLEAQVNSCLDGILVVDDEGKRLLINQRLIDLFNVPQSIVNDSDDEKLLQYVVSRVKDPEQFLEKVRYLNQRTSDTSRDELEFKIGMVFDRYSSPVLGEGGKYYGRIWTFRDITERRRIEGALQKVLAETEKVNRLMQGRETRIAALKQEVNGLLAELGRAPDYRIENGPQQIACTDQDSATPDAAETGNCEEAWPKRAVSPAAGPHPVRDLGLEKPEVNMAFIPILCAAPLLYAKSHGYFARNGLDVTLTPAPGWSGVKDLLAFGHTDAAHLLSPMPLAIRQGLDGRRAAIRLACIQNVNGQALTLALKHAGIRDVRE